MIDLRPIFLVVGILLATLGCAMMLPALYDLALGHHDWLTFAISAGLTLFVGISLAFSNRGQTGNLTIKQAFLLTALSWVVLTAFAALPFYWSTLNISYTDAFFESMSGVTTTGATILEGLDEAPPGVLLWRALLQWLGGIGIIVMAIAVLPMLQVGGMQLFRTESSDTSEKILPRATQIAGTIWLLYLGLTILCAVGYFFSGMSFFDACAHAMTTIATGGFSTHDASLAFYENPAIEMISIVFMIIGSLPFVLLIHTLRGRSDYLFKDSQVRWFIAALAVSIVLAWLSQKGGENGIGLKEFRDAAFNIVSILTGTGYVTADYGQWSGFSAVLFFCVMFIGGCAGSTSCGVKIFRFQVLVEAIKQKIYTLSHPHAVFIPRYNGRPLSDAVSSAVINFLFLFLLCFAVLTILLEFLGLDSLTAFSASASALANVGPGLGEIVGPTGNFKSLPDSAKWLLSAGMLLGRLELLTVLVLFSPAFWRT